ncbi:MAG: hypothetical protein ACT4PO_00655, partial [Actinomycetota bacterium]
MTKHENLDVLRLLAPTGRSKTKYPTQDDVQERGQHGAECYVLSSPGPIAEFVHPFEAVAETPLMSSKPAFGERRIGHVVLSPEEIPWPSTSSSATET